VAQKANLSFKNRYPYLSVIDEASDFRFGSWLGFAKAHHEITPREKSMGGFGLRELSEILGFSILFLQQLGLVTSNLAHSWGLPRPIIISHTEESVGVVLGQGSSPKFGGSLQYLHIGWS